MVVLADLREDWRPGEDLFRVADFESRLRFPTCKLIDRLETDWRDGQRRSSGKTPGEALDAILSQDDSATVVVVKQSRSDRFFAAEQHARLEELMARWRAARDAGSALDPDEQGELEALVEAEGRAAGQRAAALAEELER